MTETATAARAKARHIECTLAQYHKRREWSRSQLEVGLRSWPLFHGRFIAGIFGDERSAAKDIGTVAHECLLHPKGFDGVCAIIPPEVLNDQGHRKGKAYTDWKREHAGLIDLKDDEAFGIFCMIRNVREHPVANRLMDTCIEREHSIVWQDPDTGLKLRARPDMLCRHLDGVILVDFKTTQAVTARQFAKDIYEFGYHRELAWYKEGVEALGYSVYKSAFICSDKSPAFECNVYVLSDRAMERGTEEITAARRELKRRLRAQDWTSPTFGEAFDIDLPEWAYREDPWRIT